MTPPTVDVPAVDVRVVEAVVLRVPLKTPLRNAFGAMDARSALLLALTDAKGRTGWGEVWCNFPTFGARHRARLAHEIVGPMLTGAPALDPWTVAADLEARLKTLALQTGEFGPLAQVIGGMEMAVWDLAGQAAHVPLHRLLGSARDRVPAYASGINPTDPAQTVRTAKAEGFRAFKLKVGFGKTRDLQNAAAVAATLRPGDVFMVDANQAWDAKTAAAMADALQATGPVWLEEPLRADASDAHWRAVAAAGIPLAAGENWRGLARFDRAIAAGWLTIAQPDAGKWGGLSGGLAVARQALGAGRRFCPHHLGGAVGLVAAAHLLCAAGGDGLLEVDSNANPLRTEMVGPLPPLEDGEFVLPDGPGLGVTPDLSALAPYHVPVARDGL
ncbi:MAG: mandelate racemase/muconate lactonizing enzyme family protein [Pseudomonadota bacterium]